MCFVFIVPTFIAVSLALVSLFWSVRFFLLTKTKSLKATLERMDALFHRFGVPRPSDSGTDDDDGDDRSDDIGTPRDSIADRVAAVERRLSFLEEDVLDLEQSRALLLATTSVVFLGTFALCVAGFRGVLR
jgi:hypothetical protein|tara:strand:- start:55 stop:447 length:393 start_codon:yes stop_codon:yes gene_type:complete